MDSSTRYMEKRRFVPEERCLSDQRRPEQMRFDFFVYAQGLRARVEDLRGRLSIATVLEAQVVLVADARKDLRPLRGAAREPGLCGKPTCSGPTSSHRILVRRDEGGHLIPTRVGALIGTCPKTEAERERLSV